MMRAASRRVGSFLEGLSALLMIVPSNSSMEMVFLFFLDVFVRLLLFS